MVYLTQAQAAVYSATIGTMPVAQADALLEVASESVDAWCGRTFDTIIDPLPASVAMAVALWAESLSGGLSGSRDAIEQRIGDYAVKYGTGADVFAYSCPSTVAKLLSPYKIVVVG